MIMRTARKVTIQKLLCGEMTTSGLGASVGRAQVGLLAGAPFLRVGVCVAGPAGPEKRPLSRPSSGFCSEAKRGFSERLVCVRGLWHGPFVVTLPNGLIRLAAAEDAPGLRELAFALAEQPILTRYGLAPDKLANDLGRRAATQAGSSQRLILAERHVPGQPAPSLVGFAQLELSGAFARSPYLRLIAVRPDCWHLGLGQHLLGYTESVITAAPRDLFLLTSDFNVRAQAFYAKAGYAQVGRLPDYVCPGITELLYWKRLSNAAGPTPALPGPSPRLP